MNIRCQAKKSEYKSFRLRALASSCPPENFCIRSFFINFKAYSRCDISSPIFVSNRSAASLPPKPKAKAPARASIPTMPAKRVFI